MEGVRDEAAESRQTWQTVGRNLNSSQCEGAAEVSPVSPSGCHPHTWQADWTRGTHSPTAPCPVASTRSLIKVKQGECGREPWEMSRLMKSMGWNFAKPPGLLGPALSLCPGGCRPLSWSPCSPRCEHRQHRQPPFSRPAGTRQPLSTRGPEPSPGPGAGVALTRNLSLPLRGSDCWTNMQNTVE